MYVNVDQHVFAGLELEEEEIDDGPIVEAKLCASGALEADIEPKKEKKNKKVRFDESSNCSFPSSFDDINDTADLWYTAEDYREFKNLNVVLAGEIIKGKNEFRKVSAVWQQALLRAYKAVKLEAIELADEEDVDFDYSVLSGAERHDLVSVYEGDAIPLGMERLLVQLIATERHYRRADAIELIFRVEESSRFPTEESEAFGIRVACETVSITPRLFARELAFALAVELKKEQSLSLLSPPAADGSSVSASSGSALTDC